MSLYRTSIENIICRLRQELHVAEMNEHDFEMEVLSDEIEELESELERLEDE